jgi:hypothetical protein
MPSIPYGSRTYRRENGNFPELSLINMFLERALTSENQVALLSRLGLGLLATMPGSAFNIVGMYSKLGTLSGDVFTITRSATASDGKLHRGTTAISGTVGVPGPVSFAGGFGELLIAAGALLSRYNGTAHNNPSFPDGANVRAVEFIGSLFVVVRADTSGKFYWSAPLDGNSWDALDFATAEREPDSLLDVKALGDNIWLFGQQSIESWAHTGDADLPFTRIEQVAFDQGIMATGCVVPADNTLFFIGSKRVVYRLGQVPERISDHGIEERLAASTNARLFTFWYQGHEFVCMRLDDETLVYDCSTQEWTEFQSSEGNWIVAYAAMQGKTAYLGHATTGQIMGWSEWDDMGAALERRFAVAQQLDDPLSVDRLQLWVNSGQSDVLEGQGSEPLVEMRYSQDAGQTWSAWEATDLGNASIGGTGAYRTVPEWRALGMFDFPGMIFEFRLTDPVPFRVSAVKINEKGGGRSR